MPKIPPSKDPRSSARGLASGFPQVQTLTIFFQSYIFSLISEIGFRLRKLRFSNLLLFRVGYFAPFQKFVL